MKGINKIIIAFLCVLAFCSCQRDYTKLIVGTWELDKEASYETRQGKRHYYDEQIKNPDEGTKYHHRISFSDASTRDVRVEIDDPHHPETKQSKYHIEGNNVYIDGERLNIVELNKRKMIIEGHDEDESVHSEFHKISNDSLSRFEIVCAVLTAFGMLFLFIYFIVRLVLSIVKSIRGEKVYSVSWNDYSFRREWCDEDKFDEDKKNEHVGQFHKMYHDIIDLYGTSWAKVDDPVLERGKCILTSMDDCQWETLHDTEPICYYYCNYHIVPIYDFISRIGGRKRIHRWLQSDVGVKWQHSIDGIIWVRDVVYKINCQKHSVPKHSFGFVLKETAEATIITCIIFAILFLVKSWVFGDEEIKDVILYSLVLGLYVGVLVLLYDLSRVMDSIAIKADDRFMGKSTIYYKDFAHKIDEINKKHNIFTKSKK